MSEERHPCPECGTRMYRHGGADIGTRQTGERLVQNYKCPKCKRRQCDTSEPYTSVKDRKKEEK